MMANSLGASAIFVYTRRGYMANFLSRWGTQGVERLVSHC